MLCCDRSEIHTFNCLSWRFCADSDLDGVLLELMLSCASVFRRIEKLVWCSSNVSCDVSFLLFEVLERLPWDLLGPEADEDWSFELESIFGIMSDSRSCRCSSGCLETDCVDANAPVVEAPFLEEPSCDNLCLTDWLVIGIWSALGAFPIMWSLTAFRTLEWSR